MSLPSLSNKAGAAPTSGAKTGFSELTRLLEESSGKFAVSRGLTPEQRARFFEPKGADLWEVRPEVRSLVRFKQANLLDDQPTLGEFDLVLLRNVLLYFADATKTLVLQRLARRLRPGGYLVLGGSEVLAVPPEGFERLPGTHKPVFRRLGRK